jgi:hypothetical protein
MNIKDFHKASSFLLDILNMTNYVGLFSQFQQAAANIAGSPNNSNRLSWETQLETMRQELFKVINVLPENNSTTARMAFRLLMAENLFGENGRIRINSMMKSISKNPSESSQMANEYHQELTALYQFVNSFQQISNYSQEEFKALDEIEGFRIFFQGKVKVEDLDELAKAATKWKQVILSFALVVGETKRDVKVVSAEQGSLILTLVAIGGIVYSMAKGLNEIMDVILKSYDIKKAALELRKLKIGDFEKQIDEIEERSKINVNKTAEEIAHKLMSEHNFDDETLRNEATNAASSALRYLIRFLTNGGKIEILLTENSDDKKQVKLALNSKYEQLNIAEKKFKEIATENPDVELIDPHNND